MTPEEKKILEEEQQRIVQVQNAYRDNGSTNVKTVVNQPSQEVKTEVDGVSAPDPATMEYLRKNVLDPMARARGIDPNTGEQTVFNVLGYNPEDERKRREAEQRLNDWKRKENAWYNAFAVVGDAITSALGGNVWQRQPNNIGAQANADNQRLIAEQKAEDEMNAAKLRANGLAYANDVNNLISKYLTKTKQTTTDKTGGGRVETDVQGAKTGYKTQAFKLGAGSDNDGNGSGSSSGGSKGTSGILNIHLKNTPKGEQNHQVQIGTKRKAALADKLRRAASAAAEKDSNYADFLVREGVGKFETASDGTNKIFRIVDPEALLDNGVAYNLNGHFNPDMMNAYLDALEGWTDDSGNTLSRSQVYEMITGRDIHDNNGDIDYYAAQALQKAGLVFPGEKVGDAINAKSYEKFMLGSDNPYWQQYQQSIEAAKKRNAAAQTGTTGTNRVASRGRNRLNP